MLNQRRCIRTLPTLLLFAALPALPTLAAARDAAQDEPLSFTIHQAVEVALQLNPEVLGERERTQEFIQLVREAKSEALPRIDARLTVFQNRDPGLRNSPFFSRLLESGEELPPGAGDAFFFTNYVWNLGIEQLIYTFGRVSNALKAQHH